MGKIAKYLNQLITGNVFDTPEILEAYSTDRSILKIMPKFVAFPESTEDIQKLLRFFNQLAKKDIKVPIAIRGSGLDEMGADLSNGLIISTEKINHLMEIDLRDRLVRVQSGITLKELNTALSVNGLTLPVVSNENETIGGLISGLPNDNIAKKYGGIMNYVERLEVVLPSGDCIQTNRISKYAVAKKTSEKTPDGKIYQKFYKLAHDNPALFEKLRSQNLGAAGYPNVLKAIKKDTIDLAPIFFGAEGTLGMISEIILRVVPVKKTTSRALATFPSIDLAKKFLDAMSVLKPCELNLLDLRILKSTENSGKNLAELTKKLENGFIVFLRFDEKSSSAIRKVISISKNLPKNAKLIVENHENHTLFQEFNNIFSSYLSVTSAGERVPLLSDFSLPVQNLPDFLKDIQVLEQKTKLDLPIYGSYLNENFSIRPLFDLSAPDFNKKALTLLKVGAYIIDRRNGLICGNSPEGRVKALITNPSLSDEEKALYGEIKNIFDENGILSPTSKIGADARSVVRYIRTSSSAKIVI